MCPIASPTHPEPPRAVRLEVSYGGLDRLHFNDGGCSAVPDIGSGWVGRAEEKPAIGLSAGQAIGHIGGGIGWVWKHGYLLGHLKDGSIW